MLVKRMDFEGGAALGEDIKAADIVVGPFMAAIIALLPRGRTSFSSHPRDDLRATEPPTQPLTACWGHYVTASRRRLCISRDSNAPMHIFLPPPPPHFGWQTLKTTLANIY